MVAIIRDRRGYTSSHAMAAGGSGLVVADATSRCYQSRASHKSMSNRFAYLSDQEPVVEDGIQYWESQPASLDGVLGVYFPPKFSPEYFRFLRGSRRIWDWCRSIFFGLQDRCYGSLRVPVKVSPTNRCLRISSTHSRVVPGALHGFITTEASHRPRKIH